MPVTRRNRKSEEEKAPNSTIDLVKIKELIKLMEDHELTAFELEDAGFKVRLEKGSSQEQVLTPISAPEPAAKAASEKIVAEDTEQITSPMVGTFYKSPTPDADAFVKVGDAVDEGTVVCIIEAMKVMNELPADCAGTIAEILVENGNGVEYGQPLFKIAKK